MAEYQPIEDMSFREAMAELDDVVSLIEGNTLELEESLKVYERGVALLSALQGRLAQAEQRIDVLMGELSGASDDLAQDTTLS